MMKWLMLLGAVFSVGCSLIGIRTEEVPHYEVIHAEGVYEIREYPSYLIAETKVEGDYDEAVNKGFRRLAAYIFGNNLSRRSFQNELQVQPDSSEKMSMTAPVEVMKEDRSFWSVCFVMPSQYTIDSLPTPKDPRVVVREMGNRKTAVYKTSGFHSEEKMQKHAEGLRRWIETKEFGEALQASIMVYDPPWTLPFFRRTEITLALRP